MSRTHAVASSSDRSFGIVIGCVFFVIGTFPLLDTGIPRWWAVGLAAFLVLLALFWPRALAPANRLWLFFGLILHKIVSPLILGGIFFLAVVPTGLCMRLFGKDLLRLNWDDSASTYWIERPCEDDSTNSMKNQFWGKQLSFLKEIWLFLKIRKKYWMIPILLVLMIFGGLIVLVQGSAIAPFIYTIF